VCEFLVLVVLHVKYWPTPPPFPAAHLP
jgi:hypothetical protein